MTTLALQPYIGPPLPVPTRTLLEELVSRGFRIEVTGRSKGSTEGQTIRILRDSQDVGYVNKTVINFGALVGYHFSGSDYESDSCPLKLADSLEDWACSRFYCNPSDLRIHAGKGSNSHRTFLLIKSSPVALRALGAQARESRDTELAADLAALAGDSSIAATTRKALADARLGQGAFRDALLLRHGQCCAVTRLAIPEVLRASHIKPWRQSTNAERLDPQNGLLLSANLDALFDRGFITFSSTGALCISSRLDDVARRKVGPLGGLVDAPSSTQAIYLEFHASRVFRKT